MRRFSLFAVAAFLLPALSFGASKEQMEMQRDIAQLGDQLRTLQSSMDRNLSAMQTLLQQAFEAANKANTGVSVLSAGVSATLERELRQSLTPIAGLAAKVDNTNNDVAEIRNAVDDLNKQMNKVLQVLTDMNNTMKVLQAPPAAPPPSAATPGAAPGSGAAVNIPPATVLYGNAKNDQNSGKLDLALSEYEEFLKVHPEDPNCAGAQFNIGEIHYTKTQMDLAVQDFDAVIERYSDNISITPDAYFMKGMALKQSNRRDAAATTFRSLVTKFPATKQAEEAKSELRSMGYSTGAAAPAVTKRKPR